jgi:glucosamine-6-phosphate deaminase
MVRNTMRYTVIHDYKTASEYVGKHIEDYVKENPSAVLGLATGSTPLGIYEYLSKSKVNFSNSITFNLDEYVGLDETHPQSYRYFMNQHLFKNIRFMKNNFPTSKNYFNYDAITRSSGGIDIQILGIGTNGHIAFNEPGSSKHSATRIVDLTENTIKDNSRFFDNLEDVPKQAYTMGMSSIMGARKIFLLGGRNKKEIMYEAAFDPVDVNIPASYLQEHKNVEFILYD